MFDIGFWELFLVSLIVLLVVGPKRLPELAKQAGKYFVKLRNFLTDTKEKVFSEIDSEGIKEHLRLQDESNSILDIVKDVKEQVEDINPSTTKDNGKG